MLPAGSRIPRAQGRRHEHPGEAPGGEVLVYEAPNGEVRVDVRLDHETVWLNQEQMGQLFGRERSVITKHVRNVFREGELEASAVCAKFAHTAEDGKTYQVDHYNLDVIGETSGSDSINGSHA